MYVRFRIFVKIACDIIRKSLTFFAKIFKNIQQDLQMLTFDTFNTKRHNLPAICEIKGPFGKKYFKDMRFCQLLEKIFVFAKAFAKIFVFPKFFEKVSVRHEHMLKAA